MVRTGRRKLGSDAEQRAYRFLRRRGLRPVARNYRTRRGEIDLIMLDDGCLAFIEVRYRDFNSPVDALLTVDARKQKKLAQTASMFLSTHRSFHAHACRFDVVGVDRDRHGAVSIEWLRDAFRPGW